MGHHPYYLTVLIPSILLDVLLLIWCVISWVLLTHWLDRRRRDRHTPGYVPPRRFLGLRTRRRIRAAATRIDDEAAELLGGEQ